MTPTPPTTAPRLWVDYTGPFNTHTMLFHFIPGTTGPQAVSSVTPILNAMAATWWNATNWNNARFAPAGSTVSTPQTLPSLSVGASGAPVVTSGPSQFIQFGARNPNGKRAKWYLFENVFTANPTMRQAKGANALCDAIIDALDLEMTGPAGKLACIDGVSGTVYQYGNLGQNDYWTHQAR